MDSLLLFVNRVIVGFFLFRKRIFLCWKVMVKSQILQLCRLLKKGKRLLIVIIIFIYIDKMQNIVLSLQILPGDVFNLSFRHFI